MTVTYLQLEQALQNAAIQVETMGAIIAYLLDKNKGKVTVSADQIRTMHDAFNVIVTPNSDESITITLKEKNAK